MANTNSHDEDVPAVEPTSSDFSAFVFTEMDPQPAPLSPTPLPEQEAEPLDEQVELEDVPTPVRLPRREAEPLQEQEELEDVPTPVRLSRREVILPNEPIEVEQVPTQVGLPLETDTSAISTQPLPDLSKHPATYPEVGILPSGSGGSQSGSRSKRWLSPRRLIALALIMVALLVLVSLSPSFLSYLHTVLPAATATVTITPTSKHFINTYTLSAITGTPDPSQNQVQARFISYTTPTKSMTVQATGQGSEGATEATGTLIFSNSTGNFTIFAQTFADNSGVGLAIDTSFNIFPGQTVAIFAHAARAGSIGNVPVDDINATSNVGPGLGSMHIENTSPFTGGTDRTYSLVQQSDIDSATSSLQTQLTSDAQTAVQNQVRTNEQIVGGADSGIQCTTNSKSDHQANDRVTNFIVKGSATCKAEVYDQQAAQSIAENLLQSDAARQFGSDYLLVGNVVAIALLAGTPDNNGTVPMNVSAQGVWVFQFSNAQKQKLAQLIVGKTQADTTSLLLTQKGVSKVIIKTFAGWGNALPSSPTDIKLVILPVAGL